MQYNLEGCYFSSCSRNWNLLVQYTETTYISTTRISANGYFSYLYARKVFCFGGNKAFVINQQKAIKARYHERYWIYLKECELYMSHNACSNVGNDKIKSYSTITGTKLREFQWIISWNVLRNMLELEAHEIYRSHEQQ